MSWAPLRLVLFDLDGTLADTYPDLQAALDAALAAHGFGPGDAAAARGEVSNGALAMTRAVLPEGDAALVERVRAAFLDNYARDIAVHTRLFPGIEPVLERIESSGRCWGIVTNKLARLSEPLVDALGLRARLATLVSGDSAARPKPHPDPLCMAMAEAGATPGDTLYVGDAINDVRAARAARVRVLVARYGYLAPADRPEDWAPDGLVDAPGELLGWLER